MLLQSQSVLRRGVLAIAMVAANACSRDSLAPPLPGVPSVVSVVSGAVRENALTAHVVYMMEAPDSTRALCQADGQGIASTPFQLSAAGVDSATVLGLHANTAYRCWVEALWGDHTEASQVSTVTTGPLPAAIGGVRLDRISGQTSMYALAGVNGYAVAFDSTGDVVWYHDLTTAGLPISNVLHQANGNFTAFLGGSTGWQPINGYFVEFTPTGTPVHTYRAPAGSYIDAHDIVLTDSGANERATFFTYTLRDTDLTAIGGLSGVSVAGHQITRAAPGGRADFTWDAWSNIALDEWITDWDLKQRDATDYDHPNALVVDAAGNYVVSWRNLSQVMSIDSHTGQVLWRLGGARSDFQFVGDPLGGFSKQHSVKALANGDILVYDNGTDHDPQQSRAVEYRLDPIAKTATMVWEYRHDPPIYTQFVGWTERFANGDTWVAFAFAGRVVEVDPGGHVLWEAQLRQNGTDINNYRIVPTASLYTTP